MTTFCLRRHRDGDILSWDIPGHRRWCDWRIRLCRLYPMEAAPVGNGVIGTRYRDSCIDVAFKRRGSGERSKTCDAEGTNSLAYPIYADDFGEKLASAIGVHVVLSYKPCIPLRIGDCLLSNTFGFFNFFGLLFFTSSSKLRPARPMLHLSL